MDINIQSLTLVCNIKNEDIKQNVRSLLILHDKRMVVGSMKGTMSLYEVEYGCGEWKCVNVKEDAHARGITSLIEFDTNKVASGSYESCVNIWNVADNEIALLHKINVNDGDIWKLLNLTNKRFAYCTNRGSIDVYNNTDYENRIHHIKEIGTIITIMQLKRKEKLIVNLCNQSLLTVWDLEYYQRETVIDSNIKSNCVNGIVDLENDTFAIVAKGHQILIVCSVSFRIIANITDERCILSDGFFASLALLNSDSFLYVYKGFFCQISIKDNKVKYYTQMNKRFQGWELFILEDKGKKYIISDDDIYLHNEVSVFKIEW